MTIRRETSEDFVQISKVHVKALGTAEVELVAKLRETPTFIPELSLVAVVDGVVVVGHVLFYPITINTAGKKQISLALAPLSVLSQYQKKGIGTALIREGMHKAKTLGFESVIVLGHATYYPRFGFKCASGFRISAPFSVPDEAFMALELVKDALKNCPGIVEYPREFGVK